MKKKVVVLGIDGGEFAIINSLLEQEQLPNFKRVIDTGGHGKLRSTYPPMTFPAWSTFMTGVGPGRHGVFDFTERVEGKYGVVFANAQSRQAKTIWKIMSEMGRRVAVIGVPLTYPPENVNGAMISGFDTPVGGRADDSVFYPKALYEEINAITSGYEVSANAAKAIEDNNPEKAIVQIRETLAKKIKAAKHVLCKEEWDFFMVLLGESDVASHHYWRFFDPDSPLLKGKNSPACQNAIPEIYKQIDVFLGELLTLIDEDTTLLIMSDHGFGGNSNRALYINRWLEEQEYLSFQPMQLQSRIFTILKNLGLKYVPQALKVAIFRNLGMLADSTESKVRFSGIEWAETKAYSEETPYYPSIWINKEGREPDGIVSDGEADVVIDSLVEKLRGWCDPLTGKPVFRNVYRRDDIYSGPYINKAPDILLEPNMICGNSYLSRSSRTRSKGVCVDFLSDGELNSSLIQMKSGSHRNDGIFFGYGEHFKPGSVIEGAEIIDLAPTIFSILGLPIPKEWEGQALGDELHKMELKEDIAISSPQEKTEYSPEQAEVVRNRLRDLGYLD